MTHLHAHSTNAASSTFALFLYHSAVFHTSNKWLAGRLLLSAQIYGATHFSALKQTVLSHSLLMKVLDFFPSYDTSSVRVAVSNSLHHKRHSELLNVCCNTVLQSAPAVRRLTAYKWFMEPAEWRVQRREELCVEACLCRHRFAGA